MDDRRMLEFREAVWGYYRQHGRVMPWREPEGDGSFDPYKILVSEIMLQQTQVARVAPKFLAFVERFPNVGALAGASLGDVLREWSGLGYNRRAKFLHEAAQHIVHEHNGVFPQTQKELTQLRGVGTNTAAAVLVYAYSQPLPFIETNIRTVYIHYFFNDHAELVSDKELLPLVERSLDREHPREWYWALMDLGAHLKATVGNLSRQSKQYARHSTFQGSLRQIRGAVIRELKDGPQPLAALSTTLPDERLPAVLEQLVGEGLITKQHDIYSLA